jgi:hypothetical protein
MPEDIKTPFGDVIEGGRCENCGAVYVYDRTGRKLGEAYTEALVLAYEWDYDRAFSAPEGDYEEAVIRYNARIGRFFLGEGSFKDKMAKFYFVKRKRV